MKWKLLFFTGILFSTFSQLNAQIEGAYLHTKEFKAFGFGAFLNYKIPAGEAAFLTPEVGLYYFKKEGEGLAMIPLLLGYQYTFNGSGTGLFVEPIAGYTFGDSDVAQYDENGAVLSDPNNPGDYLKQMAKGPTAALAAGYIFDGEKPVTLGLKYQRVFVASGPAVNLATLRFSWPLFGGRKQY